MSVPIITILSLLLLLSGAAFSGLNIGLMMVRPAELKRKAAHGDVIAGKLYRYRKNGRYLIVCVLLGNVAVISTLSLILVRWMALARNGLTLRFPRGRVGARSPRGTSSRSSPPMTPRPMVRRVRCCTARACIRATSITGVQGP